MEQNFRYIWLSLNDITDSEIDHLIELIGFYENNSKYIVYYPSMDFFLWQKEVPTEVPMLTAMIGKTVKLGILKEKVFKQTKDNSGNYVDTDETREQNSINKVFSAKDNRTVNEVRAEIDSAQFMNDWLEKWEGQVSDKTANKKPTASAPAKKTSSLFA